MLEIIRQKFPEYKNYNIKSIKYPLKGYIRIQFENPEDNSVVFQNCTRRFLGLAKPRKKQKKALSLADLA